MTQATTLQTWNHRLRKLAADLYPGRYTTTFTQELFAMAAEVRRLAQAKSSFILAHNYVYPELHEVADAVGDSLGLSRLVARRKPHRVDFCGVWFMGETAKIILGAESMVYMPDRSGCSLADSLVHGKLTAWLRGNPGGIVIAYINSDAWTKSMSHYVCTSANAAKVLRHAAREFPGKRILFLPDRYLGAVALSEADVPREQVDLYDGCCHVHAAIDAAALQASIAQHPEAELLIHPECACVAELARGHSAREPSGLPPRFLSTEQMLLRARESPSREFIVATESGMVYRLRKENPGKRFYPVADQAVCEFMKRNTMTKLLRSLHSDSIEVSVDADLATRARQPIDRMLAIP